MGSGANKAGAIHVNNGLMDAYNVLCINYIASVQSFSKQYRSLEHACRFKTEEGFGAVECKLT